MGNKQKKKSPSRKGDPPAIIKWLPLIIITGGLLFALSLVLFSDKEVSPKALIPPLLGSPDTPIPLRKEFGNGDFQADEITPWFSLKNPQWGSFSVMSEMTETGDKNQFARVSAEAAYPAMGLKVFGAVQEWQQEETIPEFLNFRMRVHEENKLCTKQYAQAVVIFTKNGAETKANNLQLRILLHGMEKAPYSMSNAKFYMNPSYEQDGQWRHYSLPILKWFKESYEKSGVPESHWAGGKFRLLLEARYDSLPKTTQPGTKVLTVDYDDVTLSVQPQ